jgi:hypothetical protein
MPDKLGPRVPADPGRAARNRRTVADVVRRRDPALTRAAAAELAVPCRSRRAARNGRAAR